MKASSMLLPLLVPLAMALPTEIQNPKPRSETIYSERHVLSKRGMSNLNDILGMIVNIFPVNILIDQVSTLITVGEVVLATIFNIDTVENDIVHGNCADVAIVFSRGTTETGNVGAIVGPPFFEAVKDGLGGRSLAVQGVEYPADVPGFFEGGDAGGSQRMANLVQQTFDQCPGTKVVMSGYSQGGQLVHNAAKLLPASTMAAVSSVVIFGDPNEGTAVTSTSAGQTLVICNDGDNICDQGALILLPHLTYALDADEAANFVVAKA